jgi:chemotaxis signal transduction protein
MTRFLVFAIEPYRLMVEAVRVRELWGRDGAPRPGGGGHVAWRGRMVPRIDLASLLGRPSLLPDSEGAVDVVYGEGDDLMYGASGAAGDGGLVIFSADRVLGLLTLAESDLQPLPPLPLGLTALFSGLFLDPATRRGVLWLDAGPIALQELAYDAGGWTL